MKKLKDMTRTEQREFGLIRAARLRVAEDDNQEQKDVAALIKKRVDAIAALDEHGKKGRELKTKRQDAINAVATKLEEFIPEKYRVMQEQD